MKFHEERELFATADLHRSVTRLAASTTDIWKHVHAIVEKRRFILGATLLATLIGGIGSVAMRPLYEANLLIQIADAAGPSKGFLGESTSLFDIKTPASAEMEIMRSRMVIAPAVEAVQLLTKVESRRFPMGGSWQSRSSDSPVLPGTVTLGPWQWVPDVLGLSVGKFDVPPGWEGRDLTLRIDGEGGYSIHHPALLKPLQGKVGEVLKGPLGTGQLLLLISQLRGQQGAEFSISRKAAGEGIEDVQRTLKLSERGRQSGVMEATFRDSDPVRAADILNAIGANYIRQDLNRKTAEAENSIAFLSRQLPMLKVQMEQAEGAYNRFRARRGTVSIQDEAKMLVDQTAGLRSKLADAEQRRRELLSNMGAEHPAVKLVNEQVVGLQQEIRRLQGSVTEMPTTQQDALRLEREAKLTSELYQQLRSSLQQLQLVREGRSGNARLIDAAVVPYESINPRPAVMVAGFAGAGSLLSILGVLIWSGFSRGVRSVRDIESASGLKGYSSPIPLGKLQKADGRPHAKLLALADRSADVAVAIRQLRSQLQHQIGEGRSNRVMITGPKRGVGAHFISANLGAVMASAGQRILLVDAAGARGSLHGYFNIAKSAGFAEIIAGTVTRKQVVKQTDVPGLDLITAGTADLDVDKLASSHAFQDLMEQAVKDYDLVIVAAPPVLESADVLTMAPAANLVVLVARASKTDADQIVESALLLSQVGCFPSGVVLNAA
ncbi:MAG: GNVR domain-containing protein [Polaromonas sp.]|nr:GNVR domain-containing protein [Polaromonas sp.]